MISYPRPKSLTRSGLITTNFHLSFRNLLLTILLLFSLSSFQVFVELGYLYSVNSYSKISLTSLHNSLLVFHKVCCGYHPYQPNLDSAFGISDSLYCGTLFTDTIICDKVSISSCTWKLFLQGTVSQHSLTPF